MASTPDFRARHYQPTCLSDRIALRLVKFLRYFSDAFFKQRYGHHAVVLETVAAVPGMVAGALTHLRCLRRFEDDRGWIRTLLDEAENERAHLTAFLHVAKPTWIERMLIIIAQGVFFNAFFFFYLFWPRVAHRFVGYLEEEAVVSYTQYLADIDSGASVNVPAPQFAIDYWKLAPDARLREVVVAVRMDEAAHRDINHDFADQLTGTPGPASPANPQSKGDLTQLNGESRHPGNQSGTQSGSQSTGAT
jgi:ubiquinol oxidase